MGKGPVVFYCSDNSQECMDMALGYIKRFNLTRDDVALIGRSNETLVIAKRDISEKLK